MGLDNEVREQVVMLAGTAVGVDCQNCSYKNRDVSLSQVDVRSIECPDCDTIILTEAQYEQLRKAGKLPSGYK